jgi:hypothetical protein
MDRCIRRLAAVWDCNWTAEKVCERLIEVYRALPGMAVWSPAGGSYEVIAGALVGHLELFAYAAEILGSTSEAWRLLRAWAQARADGRLDLEIADQLGIAARTLRRRRLAAAQQVARRFMVDLAMQNLLDAVRSAHADAQA